MRKKFSIMMKDVAKATYQFEELLNHSIFSLGSTVGLLSQKTTKTLHNGYWRTYVFVIFCTIILSILMSFWIAQF